MLDKLNDVCWNTILNYLDLKEQLTLSQVSVGIHTSVQKYWARIQKLWINNDILIYFEENPNQMQDFFNFVGTSLRELSLDFGDSPRNTVLQSWKCNTFPNLRTLDSKFLEPDGMAFNQMILMQLNLLFPQVSHLTMYTKHIGEDVWLFSHLEYLILINCESIDTITFDPTRTQLDRLSLLYYEIPKFYNQHFVNVVKTAANFHTVKARSLILNYWNEPDFEKLPIELFTDLHYICLYDVFAYGKQHNSNTSRRPSTKWLKTKKIWDIVAACNNLKEFYLSYVELDVQFLRESSTYLKRVLKHRTVHKRPPLTLHFFMTGLELYQRETAIRLKHPNLKITFNQWERYDVVLDVPSIWIDYSLLTD